MRYQVDDINRYLNRIYKGAPLLVVPYSFVANFAVDMTAGTVSAPTGPYLQFVDINANGDFLLTEVAYKVNEAFTVGEKSAAEVSLMMRESGSKQPFTDAPVSLENYASNGVNLRDLDYPRFVAGGSQLELSLLNYGTTQFADGLQILLKGLLVRVYN